MAVPDWAKAQIREKLLKARDIADHSESENRDMTVTERAEVVGLMKAAKDLRDQYDRPTDAKAQREANDNEVRKALSEMGFISSSSSVGYGGKAREMHPKVKASGGSGGWAERVSQATNGGQNFKTLITGGAITVPIPFVTDPIRAAEPVLSLRQLIPASPNGTGFFKYLRQTVRTNNASTVEKGQEKPQSVYTIDDVDDRLRTIAHVSEPIPVQDLRYNENLVNFLDAEMRLGLEIALENQILNGNGSTTGVLDDMIGIGNVSGAQSQAWSTDLFATTRKALTKMQVLNYVPTGWVMNPTDWEAFELLQDNEGRYYFPGMPLDVVTRRLHGYPVVLSSSCVAGTGFLADFNTMTLHLGHGGTLEMNQYGYDVTNGSHFRHNMVEFRFEGDFGLEIRRPDAIVEIDLTAA